VQRAAQSRAARSTVQSCIGDALRTPGQALDPVLRAYFEPRFNHDFSHVRVHRDETAARSAAAIGAKAYTVGPHVVFGHGQYDPSGMRGRRLLAHELTHVLQQGGANSVGAVVQGALDDAVADEEPNVETDVVDLGAEADAAESTSAEAAPRRPAPAPAESEEGGISAAPVAGATGAWLVPHQHETEREAERVSEQVVTDRAPPGPVIATRPATFGGIHLDAKPKVVKRIDIAFVMGTDKPKSPNKFYTAAKKYFKAKLPGVDLIDDPKIRDLAAVFEYLRSRGDAIGTQYLISHAADDGTLSFPLKPGDKDRKVDYLELKNARKSSPELFTLPKGMLDKSSTVRIKGCRLGQSARMLGQIGGAFGAGKVIAPTHRQYYEYQTTVTGKGKARKEETNVYEGFKTYFVERAGKVTLTRDEQVAAFAAKYGQLAKDDWEKLVPKKRGLKADTDVRKPLTFTVTEPSTNAQALAVASAQLRKEKSKAILTKVLGHSEKAGDFELTLTDGTVRKWKGKSVRFEFETKGGGTINLSFEVPTDEKQIIEAAKADESVPDAYDWKLAKRRTGSEVTYAVTGTRTVYAVDKYIVDKLGKGYKKHLYVPPETTREFFGKYGAPPDKPKPAAAIDKRKKKR
jgi:hypothetical protein